MTTWVIQKEESSNMKQERFERKEVRSRKTTEVSAGPHMRLGGPPPGDGRSQVRTKAEKCYCNRGRRTPRSVMD